jgi:hypothetical protein
LLVAAQRLSRPELAASAAQLAWQVVAEAELEVCCLPIQGELLFP